MAFPQQSVTELLVGWGQGDKAALDELMPVVYQELRRLAQNYLSDERRGHTLQTTALVHEAYLRLVDQRSVNWQNRAQFFGVAAQMMRRILINHAVDRQAQKRQGYATKVSLDDAVSFFEQREVDLMALDEALNGLAALDAQRLAVPFDPRGSEHIDPKTGPVVQLRPARINRRADREGGPAHGL